MFKKLQIRFVALVMGVVTVILAAVFACIAIMSHQQAMDHLASDLSIAIDLSVGDQRELKGMPEGLGGLRSPGVALDMAPSNWSAPPQLGRQPEDRLSTPVAVYVLQDGALGMAERSGAVLDDEVLAGLAEEASAAPFDEVVACEQGMALLKRDVMGSTYVAFANDSARATVRDLFAIYAVVGVGALLAFFAISILFSRWALAPVRQAWNRQREFVSNASHELKTPLAIIKANTEILLDEPDADRGARAKWLASTKDSAEGMERLVEEMLALASVDELVEEPRLEKQDATRDEEPIDLSRMMEGAVLQFESRAFEDGFRLDSQIENGMSVRADAEALSRLFSILMDNACKYVEANGVVEVRLERASSGDAAKVSVSNTGPAIPPEKLDRIFDRFYRVDDAHASGGGHGLGLSIAQALSDQMDARLRVESAGSLTTFSFWLSPIIA